MSEKFFEEVREQSEVKAAIVAKYFDAWAKVMKKQVARRRGTIQYIDLFAGPGRYEDGKKSTPLIVLERALADPELRNILVTVFNDKNPGFSSDLQVAIQAIEGIESLRHQPVVINAEVGEEIAQFLKERRLPPTLFFVDPWGYRGLSLDLVNSVLKDWGCDCIFFFNYNRISMGLSNELVRQHMECLFGAERVERLRKELQDLNPEERELAIVEKLAEALNVEGKRYILPFRFLSEKGTRTSHHLIFVSKHPLGYGIMKDIMANASSSSEQGVPSFEYNPSRPDRQQGLLFDLSRPLDDLEGMLLTQFAGRTLRMIDIFNQHHVGKRYIKRNYKDVLKQLEAKRLITTSKHPSNSFGDNVMVTFPEGRA